MSFSKKERDGTSISKKRNPAMERDSDERGRYKRKREEGRCLPSPGLTFCSQGEGDRMSRKIVSLSLLRKRLGRKGEFSAEARY